MTGRGGSGGVGCYDCGRPYGDEHGFPDLLITFEAWKQISPRGKGSEGGLLCPSCICKRLHDAGIECAGAFMSGPVRSVTEDEMSAICRAEREKAPRDGVGE
jgi:hypothetical protein